MAHTGKEICFCLADGIGTGFHDKGGNNFTNLRQHTALFFCPDIIFLADFESDGADIDAVIPYCKMEAGGEWGNLFVRTDIAQPVGCIPHGGSLVFFSGNIIRLIYMNIRHII